MRNRGHITHSARILLVEDNPANQKLFGVMLTSVGCHVEVVDNGREAIEKLTTTTEGFDLVLMDIQMPDMDGIEATKKIRERGFDGVPIVAVTAHSIKDDEDRYFEAGMTDCIQKPFTMGLVRGILDKWVFNRESG